MYISVFYILSIHGFFFGEYLTFRPLQLDILDYIQIVLQYPFGYSIENLHSEFQPVPPFTIFHDLNKPFLDPNFI